MESRKQNGEVEQHQASGESYYTYSHWCLMGLKLSYKNTCYGNSYLELIVLHGFWKSYSTNESVGKGS